MTEEHGVYVIDLGPALPDCPDRLEPPWFAVGELKRTIERQAQEIQALYAALERKERAARAWKKAARFYRAQYRRVVKG